MAKAFTVNLQENRAFCRVDGNHGNHNFISQGLKTLYHERAFICKKTRIIHGTFIPTIQTAFVFHNEKEIKRMRSRTRKAFYTKVREKKTKHFFFTRIRLNFLLFRKSLVFNCRVAFSSSKETF